MRFSIREYSAFLNLFFVTCRPNRALATHRQRGGTTGSQSLRLASEQAAMAVTVRSCERAGANGRSVPRQMPRRLGSQRSPRLRARSLGLGCWRRQDVRRALLARSVAPSEAASQLPGAAQPCALRTNRTLARGKPTCP